MKSVREKQRDRERGREREMKSEKEREREREREYIYRHKNGDHWNRYYVLLCHVLGINFPTLTFNSNVCCTPAWMRPPLRTNESNWKEVFFTWKWNQIYVDFFDVNRQSGKVNEFYNGTALESFIPRDILEIEAAIDFSTERKASLFVAFVIYLVVIY